MSVGRVDHSPFRIKARQPAKVFPRLRRGPLPPWALVETALSGGRLAQTEGDGDGPGLDPEKLFEEGCPRYSSPPKYGIFSDYPTP